MHQLNFIKGRMVVFQKVCELIIALFPEKTRTNFYRELNENDFEEMCSNLDENQSFKNGLNAQIQIFN